MGTERVLLAYAMEMEGRFEQAGGERFWIEASGQPSDADGVVCVMVSFRISRNEGLEQRHRIG